MSMDTFQDAMRDPDFLRLSSKDQLVEVIMRLYAKIDAQQLSIAEAEKAVEKYWPENRCPQCGTVHPAYAARVAYAERLSIERERERARGDKLAEILVGIHGLLLGPDFTGPDGKRYVFDPADKSMYWGCYKALGDRIRAIPDEIEKSHPEIVHVCTGDRMCTAMEKCAEGDRCIFNPPCPVKEPLTVPSMVRECLKCGNPEGSAGTRCPDNTFHVYREFLSQGA